jgi:hypothetical protein
MSKKTLSALESTAAVIERLYSQQYPCNDDEECAELMRGYHSDPADSAAVIFAAIIQVRAIDRQTKVIEAQTEMLRAFLNKGGKNEQTS